jgi:exonuclease III
MQRRSAVVAKELEKIGVDVAALQETRLEGSGMIKEKEFSIFWSGRLKETSGSLLSCEE